MLINWGNWKMIICFFKGHMKVYSLRGYGSGLCWRCGAYFIDWVPGDV